MQAYQCYKVQGSLLNDTATPVSRAAQEADKALVLPRLRSVRQLRIKLSLVYYWLLPLASYNSRSTRSSNYVSQLVLAVKDI
jgi:hypothetical protein